MFIPLHDTNGLRHIKMQYVTIGLIVTNILVWAFTSALVPDSVTGATVFGLGFIPAVVMEYAVLDPSLELVPADSTALTYAFLHQDVMHLGSNMLFLWVFGDNVEDALGHFRFLIFYSVCAIAGAALHALLMPMSQAPLIGASGAISGVVAAYVLLHPRVRIWVLVLMRFPLPLPAFIPLALWIGQQFFLLATDHQSNVSWGAHVGGICAGALLVLVMRRKGVPLFDRKIVPPKAAEYTST